VRVGLRSLGSSGGDPGVDRWPGALAEIGRPSASALMTSAPPSRAGNAFPGLVGAPMLTAAATRRVAARAARVMDSVATGRCGHAAGEAGRLDRTRAVRCVHIDPATPVRFSSSSRTTCTSDDCRESRRVLRSPLLHRSPACPGRARCVKRSSRVARRSALGRTAAAASGLARSPALGRASPALC